MTTGGGTEGGTTGGGGGLEVSIWRMSRLIEYQQHHQ